MGCDEESSKDEIPDCNEEGRTEGTSDHNVKRRKEVTSGCDEERSKDETSDCNEERRTEGTSCHQRPAETTPDPPGSTDQPHHTEEQGDGLDDIDKEELVTLLRTARKELVSSNAQLAHYRQVTADLEDKRSVLVEALSVVDTLLATRATEDFQQRSIACTARPQSIDRAASLLPRERTPSTHLVF